MGKCQYVLAQDCSESKLFTVYTKNRACGWGGASCTAFVTVILAGYKIQFSRVKRTAIINGVKYTNFPIVRPGEFNDNIQQYCLARSGSMMSRLQTACMGYNQQRANILYSKYIRICILLIFMYFTCRNIDKLKLFEDIKFIKFRIPTSEITIQLKVRKKCEFYPPCINLST